MVENGLLFAQRAHSACTAHGTPPEGGGGLDPPPPTGAELLSGTLPPMPTAQRKAVLFSRGGEREGTGEWGGGTCSTANSHGSEALETVNTVTLRREVGSGACARGVRYDANDAKGERTSSCTTSVT